MSVSSKNGDATFIPFSQRQAKSQVAAREILKLGQKVGFIFSAVLVDVDTDCETVSSFIEIYLCWVCSSEQVLLFIVNI